MFLAIAAFLIQPQVAPALSFSAEKAALVQPASETTAPATETENPLPASTAILAPADQPAAASETAALPDAPVPAPTVAAPVPRAFLKAGKPNTISIPELQAEYRRKQRLWLGLSLAEHSAATFDAWSTRHAITTSGAQELNPMLRPFAGNASLYAAIQVAPLLMDYTARKMMYSRHGLLRRTWWVPQSASFVSSIFCGAHNLSVH